MPVFCRRTAVAALSASLLTGLSLPIHAAAVKSDHVEAELVAEASALVRGADNNLALRLVPEAGWHVYWRNPGDSGIPTSLSWTLPAGVTADALQWPYPHRETLGDIVNYGYAEAVLLWWFGPPIRAFVERSLGLVVGVSLGAIVVGFLLIRML